MFAPYVIQQAVYFALAGGFAALLWRLLPTRLGRRPVLRFVAAGLAVALLNGVGVLAIGWVLPVDVSYRFIAVALTFWAGGFWVPILAVRAELRRARYGDGVSAVVLLLAAVLVATGLFALFVEPNRLQLRVEHVPATGFTRPFRLVHVSDLQTVGPCARNERAAELINGLDPDLVVITGDYIAGPFWNAELAVAAARTFLASLRARHGVVVIPGHAEPPWERERIFAGLGLIELENEEFVIEPDGGPPIRVRGLAVSRPRLKGAGSGAPAEFLVVASHVPDVTTHLTGLGVHLHLAGHTHGGQIVIPGFGAPITLSGLPREYARGFFRYEDHWLNVTAGIGMEGNHAPRVRLFCPPEVCLVLIGENARPASPDQSK